MDDLSYLDSTSINGINLYAYCKNNPVMYVDPDGKSATIIVLSIIVAVLVVGSIGMVVAGRVTNNEDLTNAKLQRLTLPEKEA